MLEQMLIAAYVRGVEWADENPGDREYRFKAAGDYADKIISVCGETGRPDDIQQDIWDAARSIDATFLERNTGMDIEDIARALMAASAEAYRRYHRRSTHANKDQG